MATLPTEPDPVPGVATGFAAGTIANYGKFRTNDQGIQNRLELDNNTRHGTGVIAGSYSGALLSAGVGLAASIAPHKSIIGFVVNKTASGSVGLDPNTTNHIWLFQDGSYDANTTGTNPGTVANPAIKLGTATTNASSVTAVDNTRTEIVFGNETLDSVTDRGAITPNTLTVGGLKLSDGGLFSKLYLQTDADGDLIAPATQTANRVLAGPASGAAAVPAFRLLVTDDLPDAGTAGTYAYPSSVTTDAKGRVTSVTAGSAPLTSESDPLSLHTAGGTMTGDISMVSCEIVGSGTPNGDFIRADLGIGFGDDFLSFQKNSIPQFSVSSTGAVSANSYAVQSGGAITDNAGNASIGSNATPFLHIYGTNVYATAKLVVGTGATPPTFTSGPGVPSASEPDGSVYLRTDGTAGSTLYVRAAGAWTALS